MEGFYVDLFARMEQGNRGDLINGVSDVLVLCGFICGGHKFFAHEQMQQGRGGLPGVFTGDEISLGQTMTTTEYRSIR